MPQYYQPTRNRTTTLKQHSATSCRSSNNGRIVRQPRLCWRPPTSSPLQGEVKIFQLNRHPVRGESIFTRLVHFSWTRRELSLCLQAKSLKRREWVWRWWRWTCLQRSGILYHARLIFLQRQEASGENDPSRPRGWEPAPDWNTKDTSCLPRDVRAFWQIKIHFGKWKIPGIFCSC